MAKGDKKTTKPMNVYVAKDGYKTFMSDKGLLTEDQHKQLLGGESADLSGVSQKQMQYLLTNNLIGLKGE